MTKKINEDKYVLGIDSGFTCTGIALVKYSEGYIELVDFGYVLEQPNMKGESECARTFAMAQDIVNTAIKIVGGATNNNDWTMAIEYVFYNLKNPKSLIMQSRLLQAIEHTLISSYDDDCEFVMREYNPNTVKKSIAKSKASKDEVRINVIDKVKITKPVMDAINLLSKPAAESIFDATAIAYTHIVLEEIANNESE